MKRLLLLLTLSLLGGQYSFAQTAADYTIQLTATVKESPAQITLSWAKLAGATSYTVYRKAKSNSNWGAAIATLTPTDSTYVDANVIADSAYEYKVTNGGTIKAYGYMYAGIKAPAMHNRGTLLLVVDSTFTTACATSISRLMNDIRGDGWQIMRMDVARTERDSIIRNYIKGLLRIPSVDLKAVLLLGHVAVPYSGNLNPDAHPDHLGAWPADAYYADTSNAWNSDMNVNNSASNYPANRNIPHDGKWDIAIIQSAMIQVSRIDFYNMPAFTKTEVQLMESYLQKAHTYKMDSLPVIRRALINDNFGGFSGEAFAASGWRNFAPLVGRDSIRSLPFVATLNNASYQWAYGCGGGSFTNASGVGSTTDFTTNDVNGIFTMLFGSYFGDWNTPNNFLRAPLCADVPALTSCWAGRPHWFFHHMALGENIGYAAKLVQNNLVYTLSDGARGYQVAVDNSNRGVHIALMGDLTLRTDYIKPVTNVVATATTSGVVVNWNASPDPDIAGYYVYRAADEYGLYEKISGMVAATTFTDNTSPGGNMYYMVRAVKLQHTPSGNYYNLSIGVIDTAATTPGAVNEVTALENPVMVYPNPGKDVLNIILTAGHPGDVDIYMINQAGQVVSTSGFKANTGPHTHTLNVSHLAAGMYMVVIQQNGAAKVQKWIKYE